MNSRQALSNRRPIAVQFTLKTIFLLIGCVAVWMAQWLVSKEIILVDATLPDLYQVAGEVYVQDPTKLAVCHSGFMFDSDTWFFYIPENGKYHLSLIQSWNSNTDVCTSRVLATLDPGRHRITVIPENWAEKAHVDGKFQNIPLGDSAQVILDNQFLAEVEIKKVGAWGPLPKQNPFGRPGLRLTEPAIMEQGERVVIRHSWGGQTPFFKESQSKEVCLVIENKSQR